MINSGPDLADLTEEQADRMLRSGATGAAVLAGAATAIVIAIWFAFYLLVFVPRASP